MRALLCLVAIAMVTELGAQPPKRPKLEARADINDWKAYYDHGVAVLQARPNEAGAAFAWAHRLDPSRSEPLFGSWVAYWTANLNRFLDYLNDFARMLERAGPAAAEESRRRAFLRNPLTHQGLLIVPFAQLGGTGSPDPMIKGWLMLAEGNLPGAIELLGVAIARDPVRRNWLRQVRAGAWSALGRPDSAIAELGVMMEQLRREERTAKPGVYESKELLEYAIGLVEGAWGRMAAADAAFDRALGENLAFWPARWARSAVRANRRDWVGAVEELRQAVELEGAEGWLRSEYAAALLAADQFLAAAAQADTAIQLESDYPKPYLTLATAALRAADTSRVVAALTQYVARAPRGSELDRARDRLAALGAGR